MQITYIVMKDHIRILFEMTNKLNQFWLEWSLGGRSPFKIMSDCPALQLKWQLLLLYYKSKLGPILTPAWFFLWFISIMHICLTIALSSSFRRLQLKWYWAQLAHFQNYVLHPHLPSKMAAITRSMIKKNRLKCFYEIY